MLSVLFGSYRDCRKGWDNMLRSQVIVKVTFWRVQGHSVRLWAMWSWAASFYLRDFLVT